jgi:hypothetical protein
MSDVLIESSGRWQHDGVVDALDLLETCQHCGKEQVRFIHLLSHPAHDSLRVGYVCAAKLTGEAVASEREETAKNRAARALRLLVHRNWVESMEGSILRIWNENSAGHVRVRQEGFWWSWRAEMTGRTLQSSRAMVSCDEAKRDAVYHVLEVGDFRAD